ncbi:GGDEF domain-containing protein [Pseudomonas sp. R5(2019)]|uniref:GGDEF domain-containing protein n=1 Tax=Pseudomonas sp. R5(2019) TaxID=2697566 RepID=UPI001412780F|nr:diguanylate cyclase [Pseudomonas sp. R5(2019)]
MTRNALQKLLIKRFLLAAGTYALLLLLVWVAILGGYFHGSLTTALISTALVILCQGALAWVFFSGRNKRFADPGLTEFQVLLALGWHTWLLANLQQARGTFLMFYALILMFGLFHLRRRVLVRCAVLVFFSFGALNLWEAWQQALPDPGLAAIQVCALLVILTWLCLYASYVQVSRLRIRKRRFALQAHQDTLRGMMQQLEDLVATDELTGLYNRRHFLRLASNELTLMRADQRHGLALIDLDNFKRINDRHGHATGDQVLQVFAAVAGACLREGDVLARYGGEEFVLLIPESNAERFSACCERLRLAFASAELAGLVGSNLSLSVGMTLISMNDGLDEALHRADQALYMAKRDGRNRCAAAWEGTDA